MAETQVKVFVVDGYIHDIQAPPGVRVTVYDYDIDGLDPANIDKDDDGCDCYVTQWEFDAEQSQA